MMQKNEDTIYLSMFLKFGHHLNFSVSRARNAMKVIFQRNPPISSVRHEFHSACTSITPQVICSSNLSSEEIMLKILNRRWTLMNPDTKIHQIKVSSLQTQQHYFGSLGKVTYSNNPHPSLGENIRKWHDDESSFYIVRDDLLHPLVNGNKARKLDALIPLVEDHLGTDVVTCGGCQSAHAAAVAVSCAERGLKAHLLLRGEQPQILTGYNLISMLYGSVTYVPRSIYANREELLSSHASSIGGSVVSLDHLLKASSNHNSMKSKFIDIEKEWSSNSKKTIIINEGAGDAIALPGLIRLVQYLSQDHVLGKDQALKIIVDAGTGTTAVGLGIGALCLGLPWEVTAVMLADTTEGYKKKEQSLISELCRCFDLPMMHNGIVNWVERQHPRKFGNVLKGEIEACQQIAQETGVLVDPIYTLAGWELASQLSQQERKGGAKVVMLHTGGTLGMFGLAQRYKSYF